jgi:hypothetical protein
VVLKLEYLSLTLSRSLCMLLHLLPPLDIKVQKVNDFRFHGLEDD